MSLQALQLVVKASQTPDLYRWKDGRYHAPTPEYVANDPQTRRESNKGKATTRS